MASNIFAVFAALMMVTACGQPPPKISSVEMDRLRQAAPGITEECARKIEIGGVEAIPSETEKCFQMLPAQRWRGLWRNDFEGSVFCSAPAERCSVKGDGSDIWLASGAFRGQIGALYEVVFDGRRTKMMGDYGHLGMSSHEIVVDRPISIKLVGPAPPPPSKAEIDAEWRRCEAAGNCISIANLQRIGEQEQ